MTLKEILMHLEIDGWCVIEGVIPEEKVAQIRQEIEAVTAAQGVSRTYQGVVSAYDILGDLPTFVPHISDARVLNVAENWFGPHARISFTSTLITHPGNDRGRWHADWPYNQEKPGHIEPPYPDFSVQLSSLWMISDFTEENGGTWIVPGSHRVSNNPTGDIGVPLFEPYPTEMNATGRAGSVMLFDSRLWHATATNHSDGPRVGMVVRYIPWWFNAEILMPGSEERRRMVDEPGLKENEMPAVEPEVYEGLPEAVKPLYRHWVRGRTRM